MAKKSKIKIRSIQYENNDGELHEATMVKGKSVKHKAGHKPPVSLTENCNCGDELCIEGIKYRCMADPFGDCVWFKTTESCGQ